MLKCLLSKWHWFWDKWNEKEFAVVKCSSKLMMAVLKIEVPVDGQTTGSTAID